jgi:hypothetical protein
MTVGPGLIPIGINLYCFTSRSRIFHSYGDITIAHEGLQNLGLCSGPFSRQGSLSCHTCCDMGPRVFFGLNQSPLTIHKGMPRPILTRILTGPHSVASYNTQRDAEDLF